MEKFVHPVAGVLATLCVVIFWLATAGSELSGSTVAIRLVKTTIPWGFLILIPALMVAGITGVKSIQGTGRAGRRKGLVGAKIARMRWIAANGILILMPSAFFLAYKAKISAFDRAFFVVQALELVAGLVNIALLGMNMRDGFRMKRR